MENCWIFCFLQIGDKKSDRRSLFDFALKRNIAINNRNSDFFVVGEDFFDYFIVFPVGDFFPISLSRRDSRLVSLEAPEFFSSPAGGFGVAVFGRGIA